jgi:hypothetical protein
MEMAIEGNNRVCADRRRDPTPIFSRYTFWGGNRKTIRRGADEKKHLFVDIYSARLFIAVLSLICLSCLDGFLTLLLIEEGSVIEANPIMAYFLGYGAIPFTLFKFNITALALTVMVLFKNVRITKYCLPLIISVYIAIIIYELYLYSL